MHFDLQIVALAAVLCVNVAVPRVLGVDFTLSRRSLGGRDFDRRQPQLREMIVVYLRLASGEEMTNHMLVVTCAPTNKFKKWFRFVEQNGWGLGKNLGFAQPPIARRKKRRRREEGG